MASCKPSHKFAYYNKVGQITVGLPDVTLPFYQDAWGYFNGQLASAVPSITYSGQIFQGGARLPDAAYAKIGSLQRITYPTGGFTDFFYEGNSYYDITKATNVSVGGIRLLQRSDDDGTGKKIVRNFSYNQSNEPSKSSGSIDAIPVFFKEVTVQIPINYTSTPSNTTAANLHAGKYTLLEAFSSPVCEYGRTQGSPVGYSSVTVTEPNRGKTVYKYSSFSDKPDVANTVYDNDYTGTGHVAAGGPATCFVPKDSKESERGLLLSIEDFDNAGNLKRAVKNAYTVTSMGERPPFSTCSTHTANLGNEFAVQGIRGNVNYYLYGYVANAGKLHFAHPYTSPGEMMGYWGKYTYTFPWIRVDNIIEELYDQQNTGNKITIRTDYEYSLGNLMVNKNTVTNSDGKKLITTTTYPFDYGLTGSGTDVHLPLKSKYLAGLPIERVTYEVLPNGTTYILGGELNEYNSVGLPSTKYVLELAKPLTSSLYKFSNNNTVGALPPAQAAMQAFGFSMYDYLSPAASAYPPNDPQYPYIYATHHAYAKDTRYVKKATFQYDGKDNLVQLQPWASNTVAAPPSCNIMDASGTNIIASVANAAFDMCAYTGFEGNDLGNWSYDPLLNVATDAKTGKSCFAGGGVVKFQPYPVPSGRFKVSFWARYDGASTNPSVKVSSGSVVKTIPVGKTWGLYEAFFDNIVGNVTLSPLFLNSSGMGEKVKIDDLRIHPADARMTTYTHQPLVGVTSVTDINNVSTYYEYDPLNRPYLTRDQDGNIRKKTTYGYKQ